MSRLFLSGWGIVLLGLLVTGCGSDSDPATRKETDSSGNNPAASVTATEATPIAAGLRWYTADRVQRGAAIFADNCAGCHGEKANGHFTWRKRGADGKYPPPPLNGTGHAWHHPTQVLAKQIKIGTPGGQGTMPGFGGTLNDNDVVDAIAWLQSLWPDKIYDNWRQIEGRARTGVQ